MGKFFGRNVTKRIGINELACGKGSVGVRETYDTYFFGIKTSSGKTRDVCIKKELIPNNSGGNSLNLNSTLDEIEQIALRKYVITRSKTTGWYRWSCKDDPSISGISGTRSGAASAGKSACGKSEVIIDDVLVTKIQAHYEEKKSKM